MSIFGLDEGARCLLWSEAKECKLSTGMVKGISAVVAMIREAMGEESSVSGREKVIKRSLFKEDNLTRRKRVRKAATARDVHKLVDEARRSDKRSD